MAIWRRFFGSAASNAAGYAVGGVMSPVLEPLTQDLVNESWTAHPVRPLSPDDAAEATIRDLLSVEDAQTEAARSGLDTDRFKTKRGLAGEPPGGEQLLELLNRGAISDDDATRGLKQSRLRPEWIPDYKKLRFALPSVSDMVRFAVREVYDPASRAALDLDAEFPAAFAEDAVSIGLAANRAKDYWAAHWELPSYSEGTEMLFRGEITQEQFDGLLKALDYAPTWRPKLRNIARRIPTITDMIRFAVREVWSPAIRTKFGQDDDYPDRFTTEARKHGLSEEDAKDYWAAHWELPSVTQGFTMLHRGEVTDGELDLLLRAKDVMPFWRERLKGIAHLIPGRIDLRRLYQHDLINRAAIKSGYVRLGYTSADAELLTQLAEATTTATTTNPYLTRARGGVYTAAHASYLNEEIDRARSLAALEKIGNTAAVSAAIVDLWDEEDAVKVKPLSAANVKKAYKKGDFTVDDAVTRLVGQNWTAADAREYLTT